MLLITTAASASRRPSRIASSNASIFDPRPEMRMAIFGFVIMRDKLPLSVDNRRGQKWDHYFVVPDEGESAAGSRNRPAHHIGQRTILLNEVEVRRVESLEFESEIANDGH